ncbi:MAG: hypothetical protein ACOC8L_01605 [Spirochaetota bacterium]
MAVPHHLHNEIYVAAAEAGKDILGEKPFGIDLEANRSIIGSRMRSSRCSRRLCSSAALEAHRQRATMGLE